MVLQINCTEGDNKVGPYDALLDYAFLPRTVRLITMQTGNAILPSGWLCWSNRLMLVVEENNVLPSTWPKSSVVRLIYVALTTSSCVVGVDH